MWDSAEVNDLIARASQGDQTSLEALLFHFHDPVHAYIGRILVQKHIRGVSAEDVLQETFMEVFRRVPALRPEGGTSFFAWLRKIARSKLINLLRAQHALKRGGGFHQIQAVRAELTVTSILGLVAARDPTPSRILRRKEAIRAMVEAMGTLDPEKQKVLDLHYGRGKSVPEIAVKMKKGQSAVKMLISRAVKELRMLVAPKIGDVPSDL